MKEEFIRFQLVLDVEETDDTDYIEALTREPSFVNDNLLEFKKTIEENSTKELKVVWSKYNDYSCSLINNSILSCDYSAVKIHDPKKVAIITLKEYGLYKCA